MALRVELCFLLVGFSLESQFNVQHTRFRASNAADISMRRAAVAGKEEREKGGEGLRKSRRKTALLLFNLQGQVLRKGNYLTACATVIISPPCLFRMVLTLMSEL